MKKSILRLSAVLTAAALFPTGLTLAQSTWNVDAGGNWNTAGNWNPSGVPNGIGVEAIFGNTITASRTITVDNAITVGVLSFTHTNGKSHNLSRGTGAVLNRLIMDDTDGTANINITGDQMTNFSTPMNLIDDLAITYTATVTPTASGNLHFNGAILSNTSRVVTYTDNSTVSSGSNRITFNIGNCFDNFTGSIQIRGTGTLHGTHSIDLYNTIGAHVPIDIDTSTYLRPSSVTYKGTVNFGTTNAVVHFAFNQGNAGNTNFRMAGPITGGNAGHAISFEGSQTQYFLDNPNANSTYQGTIQILSQVHNNPVLWIGRDDQLGDPGNGIQFTVGGSPVNSFSPSGGLAIMNDLTTARNIRVGATSGTDANVSILTPASCTLTLNGAADQISRFSGNTSTGHSFIKTGPGTLVLTGNASFNSSNHFRGNNNAICGTLRLDNATVNVTNRLGAAVSGGRLLLSDGRLEFLGGTTAPQSETILRDLRPLTGGSEVLASNGIGQTSTVTFTAMTRNVSQARGQFPTINFDTLAGSADPIGTANNQILLTAAPVLTNGIIGGWARVGNDWATYGANGVAPLASYTDLGAAGATDNASMSADATLTTTTSLNSLKLAGTGLTLGLGGQTLTIGTGGLLNTGLNTISGSGSIAPGGQLFVQDNGALTISSSLGSGTVLVKSGTGTTTLSAANSQTATVIDEGTLVVSANDQLGAAMTYTTTSSGYVAIAGGTLQAVGSFSTDRAIVLGATETTLNNLSSSAVPYTNNTIEVATGQTLTVTGKVTGGSGVGGVAFTKTGLGTLILANPRTTTTNGYGLANTASSNSPNDFIGSLVLQEGVVRVTTNGNLGTNYAGNPNADTNDLIFRGGTLEVNDFNVAIGSGVNSRAYYIENGGGSIRFVNLTANRSFTIAGTEGLVYRGTNPGSFDILEDTVSNGIRVANLTFQPTSNTAGTQETIWRLTGSNSNYRGVTTIGSGTVLVAVNAPSGANGAFGNATTAIEIGSTTTSPIAGENINLYIDAAGVTIARNINVATTGGVNNSLPAEQGKIRLGGTHASGTSTYSGTITLGRSFDVTAAGTGTVQFSGLITDGALSAGLTKTGIGTVTLSNTTGNTYDGGTTIEQGTLLVSNSSGSATGTAAVTVLAGTTLGGTGAISGTVTVDGTCSPGESTGTLALAGNYTQSTTGTLKIELGGTSAGQYDVLTVGGTASLDGVLEASLVNGYMPNNGDTFVILTCSTLGEARPHTENLPPNFAVDYNSGTGQVTLTYTNAQSTHTLSLDVNPAGQATVNGAGTYNAGSIVPISVTGIDSAYKFVNWSGTGIGDVANANAATTTVTLNGDYALTANLALKTYTDWAGEQGVGAANLDSDGDGIKNGVEYAFGLNPLVPNANSAVYANLTGTVVDISSHLKFSYLRPAPANLPADVSIVVRFSNNLTSWTDGVLNTDYTESVTGTNPQTVTVTLIPTLGTYNFAWVAYIIAP